MGRQPESIPVFENEAEEQAFWEANDSSDHVDWTRARRARLVNLRPSTKSISLRLPLPLLEQIKVAANRRDVPYQSLIKVWLSEKIGWTCFVRSKASRHRLTRPRSRGVGIRTGLGWFQSFRTPGKLVILRSSVRTSKPRRV